MITSSEWNEISYANAHEWMGDAYAHANANANSSAKCKLNTGVLHLTCLRELNQIKYITLHKLWTTKGHS